MPTLLALDHPRAAERDAPHFPYIANVRALNAGGSAYADLLADLPAAYQPAAGQSPQAFEGEAPVPDKVLLMGWHPGIKSKNQQLKLTFPDGATVRYFHINDVLPGDAGLTTTLLTVSPWTGGK